MNNLLDLAWNAFIEMQAVDYLFHFDKYSIMNNFILSIVVGIINNWNMKLIAFGGARGQLE